MIQSNKKFEKKPDTRSEKTELSVEQKEQLANVWTEMVVDGVKQPENVGEMSDLEIKSWLNESVKTDSEKLASELGLEVDGDLIEKIKQEEDVELKSALELDYIKQAHQQIDSLIGGFDRSGVKSTKWDSWPKKMRETGEFNCLGATLLGTELLNKGGIESYCGKPVGHVVNIVKLSNGDWWYVDFRNGEESVVRIQPDQIEIEGSRVLVVNQENLYYELIPMYDNSEITGSVLGNLSSLQREATESTENETVSTKEAKEFMDQYGTSFSETNISELHQTLFPESIIVDKSMEMQNEKIRIDNFRKEHEK